jgi:outer membrane protein with beta-barrel domain
MARKVLAVLALLVFALAATATAQERGVGPGRVEIGAFPGGGMFFTKTTNGNEPAFGNYALGGTFAVNLNRWIGIEGEGGGTIGVHQTFDFANSTYTDQRTPHTWMYQGSVVVNPAGNNRSLVPYAIGGFGGVTLSPRGDGKALGIEDYKTFLAGNLGGGLKWFSTNHIGFRGDYRFFMVKKNDTAPLFFGNETRYGHRVQGGMVFTF